MPDYDVFVSWGSPDREAVLPLARRLHQLGLRVFEYTRDMSLGDEIVGRVQQAIARSSIAIVCLSDASSTREWITTEIAWIDAALRERRMKNVIPIRVGTIKDLEQLPSLLKNRGLFIGDFSDPAGSEDAVENLVDKTFEILGGGKPLWLPAAVFALTEAEFDALVKPRAEFLKLCTYVGMKGEYLPTLRKRYGASPDLFKPFGSGPTARETVESAVGRLNVARKLQRLAPIHLRWMNRELTDANDGRRRKARDRWGQRHSLMVIDSISVFQQSTRDLVTSLAAQRDRTTVLWIPPYTTRTGELQQLIDDATSDFDQLNDCVRHWYQPATDPTLEVRKRVFDVGTNAGLWHWVFLMLADLNDRDPNKERVSQFQAVMPGPAVSPSKW